MSATVYEELGIFFALGEKSFKHKVLVEKIGDDVIQGLDFTKYHDFKLDLKEGTLRVGNEALELNRYNESTETSGEKP